MNQLFSTLNSMGLPRVAVLYQDDGCSCDLLNSANALAPKYKIEPRPCSPYDRITGNVEPADQRLAQGRYASHPSAAISAPAANFIKGYKQRGGTAMLIGPSPVTLPICRRTSKREQLRGYVASTTDGRNPHLAAHHPATT